MDQKQKALEKINAIRNSIIGGANMNWSEHIYPLVAALNEAGIEGMDYPEARENFGTMLERAVAAEGMAARLWSLLDDIDTLDDSCKSFDVAFRKKTHQVQQKRHEMIRSDGKHLYRLDTGMRLDGEEQLAAAPKNPLEREVLTITYQNHRDEIADRRIIPQRVWFGKTEWHPEPQWLLSAWDKDREVERDFAVKRILCPKVSDHLETTRISPTTLDEIAAEHGREVETVLSGHYTAQKTPAECIAAITADALAKAGAVWEKRLAEQGKVLVAVDLAPSRFEKLLNVTRADLAKDVLGVPICPVCNGAEWITDAEKKTVRCECFEKQKAAATEQRTRAQIVVAFLDEIETTEIVTADGCDRDVDPEGFGFSGEMMKLIEAIAEDEDDVWNTAARCALAGRKTVKGD